jgi:hypothetical protein
MEYHRLYTQEDQKWRVPFSYEILGDSQDLDNKLQDLKKELPTEQIYRYPINKDGKTWLGAFAFEPKAFMGTVILPLEMDFQRLEKQALPNHRHDRP